MATGFSCRSVPLPPRSIDLDKAEINVLQLWLFGEPVVEHRPREADVPADAVAR
jgi:hypothetical protein